MLRCRGFRFTLPVTGALARGAKARAYESLEALLADLDQGVARGDWVVVKGSRGMRMERVVQHLEGRRS